MLKAYSVRLAISVESIACADAIGLVGFTWKSYVRAEFPGFTSNLYSLLHIITTYYHELTLR